MFSFVLGNLHFQQDPNDPQKWIITNDSAATTQSSQATSHSHNQSSRMTGGGDSPNMMAGEYEMGIDDVIASRIFMLSGQRIIYS